MKIVAVDVYQAVPVYEMFPDCFYTHIDDIAYFFVPTDLYQEHFFYLPKHIVSNYPFNVKSMSNVLST